jgi:hypothetical protein
VFWLHIGGTSDGRDHPKIPTRQIQSSSKAGTVHRSLPGRRQGDTRRCASSRFAIGLVVSKSMRSWAGWELGISAVLGSVVGLVVTLLFGGDAAGFALAALAGLVLGACVGGVAVVGGRFALGTVPAWRPASNRWWRQRFAICTSAAVGICVGLVAAWLTAFSSTAPSWAPLGSCLMAMVVAYLLALLLCPPNPNKAG